MNEANRNFIKNYLHRQKICVLTTVDKDGNPEAASMAFSETEDIEIIFQTPNTSRKYENLKSNPRVAIVVGWDLKQFDTLQYEGVARESTEGEINKYRKIHVAKNPHSSRYAYLKENKYFLVKPRWVRYTDFKVEPNKVITIEFRAETQP